MARTCVGKAPMVNKENTGQKRKRDASTSGGSPVDAPRKGTAPSSSRQTRRSRESEAEPERTEEQNEGLEPIPPIDMFFPPIHYASTCKLYCACDDVKTVELIEEILTKDECKYFDEHPSFKHVMHMPRADNHKLQHLWFTLLRTVKKTEGKVVWFLVNGVPIRYSIKEHGLLCGFSCKKYPRNFKQGVGSRRYAVQVFGRYSEEKATKITLPEVLEKFKTMPPGTARVKTALLLFLSTVIAKSKTPKHIDFWLIRAVDDLEACKKFPWGRYSFDHQLKWILKAANHFKGRMLKTYTLPGFFYPISMLVCEAIPAFREEFRIEHPYAYDHSCPRMCKTEWAPTDMKGWPLDAINHVLGDTKEINSTLTPTEDEKTLLKDIMAGDDLDFGACELTMNWNACIKAKKKIFFEDFFKLDVNGRAENLGIPKALSLKEELTKMFDEGLAEIKATLGEVVDKLDNVDGRLRATEADLRKVMAWRISIDPMADAKVPDFDTETDAGVETEVGVETEAGAGVETETETAGGVEKETAEAEEDEEDEEDEENEEDAEDEENEEDAEEDEVEEEEEGAEEDEGEEDAEEDEEEGDDGEDEDFQATLASVKDKSKKRAKKD